MRIIQAIFFMCLLISCEYNDTNKNTNFINGTYKGALLRSHPLAKFAPLNITVTFTRDRFSGEVDKVKFQVTCNGTYRITGQEIEFFTACPRTAEFDWTLILNGKYMFTINGRQLEMKRNQSGLSDCYKLELQ